MGDDRVKLYTSVVKRQKTKVKRSWSPFLLKRRKKLRELKKV